MQFKCIGKSNFVYENQKQVKLVTQLGSGRFKRSFSRLYWLKHNLKSTTNDKSCQHFPADDGPANKEEYFDVRGRYVTDVNL